MNARASSTASDITAHVDAILSLDPSEQPLAVAEAFGQVVDTLAEKARTKGIGIARIEAVAMHHAAIARLRSEIGVDGVRTLLAQAVALNEELGTRKVRGRPVQ